MILRAVLVLLLIAACNSTTPTARPTPTPAATEAAPATPTSEPSPSATAVDARAAGWRSDIGGLIERMARLHPDIGHGTPRTELDASANELVARVSELTDDELLAGVMRIVALVSREGCDAHTGAYVWGGSYKLDSLPLRLWLFEDGVYIVDALAPYQALVGQRIEAIAGKPTADVLTLIDPLVPRDNSQTVKLLAPRFLLIPQILRGVRVPTTNSVVLALSDGGGPTREVVVAAVPMADYNAWAGEYGLHIPGDPKVLYLSRMDEVLWFQKLTPSTLFVQYNQMQPTDLAPLTSALDDPALTKVILDVRHNFGGEVSVVNPVLETFSGWAARSPRNELYVITGRNTFSAASLLVARLVDQTDATVVGEAMGGCPSGWGNSREFTLTSTKIPISVSTFFEVGVSADDTRMTIEPDVAAPLTPQAWRDGVDPALVALGLEPR